MTSENKYTLHFVDGTKESDFDLVVGGDGAWSKVRPLLTTVKPLYSGVSCLEVWSEKQNPWLREYVGVGSMFAFGKDRAIQSQTQGDGSIRSYAVIRAPEDFMQTCGIDWNKPEQARKDLMDRYFSHIGHDLQRVILESKDEMAQRPLYELPVDFTWPHRAGITLIGDAAHVMTPFAGVGVNVGLTDSLILAREIIKASRGEISLDEGLKAYEVEMFPRAQKNAEKTLRGKEGHLSEGGAERFADMVKSHKGPELTLGEPLQHNH